MHENPSRHLNEHLSIHLARVVLACTTHVNTHCASMSLDKQRDGCLTAPSGVQAHAT